jgi:hypothetical protein
MNFGIDELHWSGIAFLCGGLISAYIKGPTDSGSESALAASPMKEKNSSSSVCIVNNINSGVAHKNTEIGIQSLRDLIVLDRQLRDSFGLNIISAIDADHDVNGETLTMLTLDLQSFLDSEKTFASERRLSNALFEDVDRDAYRKLIFRGEHWGAKTPGLFRFEMMHWNLHCGRFIKKLKEIKMQLSSSPGSIMHSQAGNVRNLSIIPRVSSTVPVTTTGSVKQTAIGSFSSVEIYKKSGKQKDDFSVDGEANPSTSTSTSISNGHFTRVVKRPSTLSLKEDNNASTPTKRAKKARGK